MNGHPRLPFGTARTISVRLLVLVVIGSGFGACSRHHGTVQVCEPTGARIEQPEAGQPVHHPPEASPEATGDGWSVSTLRAADIDPEPIGLLLQAIETGTYTKVDSILVARNGELVLEAYFNGFDRDTKHDTQSVSKSLASALAGIAVDKGLIASIDQPISAFFPDRWPSVSGDLDRKGRITLAHLLTMTSGFAADDTWGIGPARVPAMRREADWYAHALDLPMARAPGARFSYHSPTAVLVGGAVEHAAGEPLSAFAKTHLFGPLGIAEYCWSETRGGQVATNSGFFLRPRDMLKFGQLYLDRGEWQGRRILSQGWVADSTRKQVAWTSADSAPPKQGDDGFGYLWWTRRTRPGDDPTFDLFVSSGNGGQKIVVFPSLGMVTVFTGSHYGEPVGHDQVWEMLNRYILPAALAGGQEGT